MENHYHVLGVRPEAGPEEIKKAFRQKAKVLHPDAAARGTEASDASMRRLLSAYKTLRDSERRFAYDRIYRGVVGDNAFDYLTFLRSRKDDPESMVDLIVYCLIHDDPSREETAGLADEAVEAYLAQGGPLFPLEHYLGREDWMDLSFLLAEALEKKQRYQEARKLLAAVLHAEKISPYFRHFAYDVKLCYKRLTKACEREYEMGGEGWVGGRMDKK